MKKILFLSALIFLGYVSKMDAQDTDPREKATFGIKAGLNSSNVWDEKGQDFEADAKLGFVGGAFLGIPIGKFLGFQPELLVSQKGFQGAGTLFGTPYSFTRTTTYLDIPLQLQVKPIEFLTIVLGPQYSYLFHQKDEFTYGSNAVAQEQEFENDNIRKNVLGFVFGADINISHLVVSGRMGWDFQTNVGDGSSYTPRYKNQWIQLTIGFKI